MVESALELLEYNRVYSKTNKKEMKQQSRDVEVSVLKTVIWLKIS